MARKVIRVISHNGSEYLSLNYASQICGYHKDYLGQIIRGGKLKAEKIRSSWFIEKNNFKRFLEDNDLAGSNLQKKEESPVDLKKEIVQLKNALHSLESKLNPGSRIFSSFKKDPVDAWDKMLLGKDPKTENRFFKFLNPEVFKPLATPLAFTFLVSGLAFFLWSNPGLASKAYLAGKNFLNENVDLVGSKIAKLDPELILDYASLKTDSFYKNLPESVSNFKSSIEKTPGIISSSSKIYLAQANETLLLNTSLVKEKTNSFLGFLENASFNSGKYLGFHLRAQSEKAGEGLASLLKKTKSISFKEEPVTVPESQTIHSATTTIEEELSLLKSQGLSVNTPSIASPGSSGEITRTIVEKTIERIISGLSQKELDSAIAEVNSKLLAEVSGLKSLIQQRSDDNFRAIALSNRINSLSSPTISNATVSNVSGLDDDDIPNDITIASSNALSATSGTFSSSVTIS